MPLENRNIIIIGAGLVGSLIACLPFTKNNRVILIDDKPLPDFSKMGAHDGRKIVLSYGSIQFLEKLGLWKDLSPHATAITAIDISKENAFSSIRLKAADYPLPALGYVLSAEILQSHLQKKAIDNVAYEASSKLSTLHLSDAKMQITFSKQGETKTLDADLVIAADGANSFARKLAGIAVDEKDSTHGTFIAPVTLKSDHQHKAHERFLSEGGVVAFLPRDEKKGVLIYTDAREKVETLSKQSSDAQQHFFTSVFLSRIAIEKTSEEAVYYPISEKWACEQTRDRFILMGNAAYNFSPVAAQGFNLTIKDIAALHQYFEKENNFAWLSAYEKTVRQHQEKIRARMQTISLAEETAPFLVNLAFAVFDALPSQKMQWIKLMAGV